MNYSDFEKQSLVDEFNEKSISARKFTKEHNIKYTTFLNWIHSSKFSKSNKKMIDISNLILNKNNETYINIKINNFKIAILKDDIKSFIEGISNDWF